MHLGPAVAALAVVFPAELPDKTLIATLVMSARSSPAAVWAGAAAAFAVHVTLAATAGGLLTLLPHRLVEGVVTVAFLAGAAVLLLRREEEEVREGEEAVAHVARPAHRVAGTAFLVILAAEWGDISQVLTANLSARYHDPLSVGVGALIALWLAAGLAVVAGRSLVRVVPLALVRRVAGVVLLGFAAASALQVAGH